MSKKGIDKKYKKTLKDKSKHNESLVIMLLRLKESIEKFSEKSSKQTQWIIGLTIAIAFLTAINIGLFGYQIYTDIQQSKVQHTLTDEIIKLTEEIVKQEKTQTEESIKQTSFLRNINEETSGIYKERSITSEEVERWEKKNMPGLLIVIFVLLVAIVIVGVIIKKMRDKVEESLR